MTLPIDRIGKFELMERLGEGGLGEVFLARDTIIGREVALKIIRKAALPAPEPEARFLRECLATSRLSHPNLATLHEFGDKGGILYQALDHLPDGDLGDLLRDHALTPKEALDWLAQACDGLAYLHQRGICHRNLKPANVRVGRVAGRPAPKLMDGGYSRAAGVDAASAAAQLETLNYAAPETLGNGKVDGRADLFSIGAMLYEALTGRRPFAAATPAEVIQRVREEEPPELDLAMFPDLSPAIQAIVRQALAKDPARRYPTAEVMAEVLRAARNPAWTPQPDDQWTLKPGKPLPAQGRMTIRPATVQPTGERSGRTGAVWAWILAVAVLAGAAGGGYIWWNRTRRARPSAPPLPRTVASPLQPAPVPVASQTPPGTPAPAGTAPAGPNPPADAAAKPGSPAPAAPVPNPTPGPGPNPAAAKPASPAPAGPGPNPAVAAKPAPPTPGAPAAGGPKGVYRSLDEAGAALERDPEGALVFLEKTLAVEPDNERAHAYRIVALYDLHRYPATSRAIRDAREAGYPLWPLALKHPPLRQMLERDNKDPHLPRRKPAAPAPEPQPAP